MRKLYCFLLIHLLMCLSVWNFFLTNTHGLQVLLGPFLLLTSYSQLLTHPSSVFRLEITGLFHLQASKRKKATFELIRHGSSPSYPPAYGSKPWMEVEVIEGGSCLPQTEHCLNTDLAENACEKQVRPRVAERAKAGVHSEEDSRSYCWKPR